MTDRIVQKVARLGTLDILRGFFLFVVIVDHVELYPSVFDMLTGRGLMWVSAAEGFFFVSGLLVGYIYRRKLALGLGYVFKKIWRRAAVLYAASAGLTLGFTFVALQFPGKYIKYGLLANTNWQDIIWQTLTLQYTYGWGDFLSRYAVFMLFAPFVIYLLSKKQWWIVVLASLSLWWVRGEHFTWAWQLVFMGGIVAGYYWQNLVAKVDSWKPKIRKIITGMIYVGALATFIYTYLSVFLLNWMNNHTVGATLRGFSVVWGNFNQVAWVYFDKWTLEPGRIIVFALWFAAGYLLVDKYWRKIPVVITNWLRLLGTNSLYVYGVHAVVIFAIHLLWNDYYWTNKDNVLKNFMITVLVLGIVTGAVWVKNVFKRKKIDAADART